MELGAYRRALKDVFSILLILLLLDLLAFFCADTCSHSLLILTSVAGMSV